MRLRPPYESEKALLGCIILSPELLCDIRKKLAPHDFFMPDHQTIFMAMCELHDKHQCMDIHMLVDYLPETKNFEQYLLMLATECCSTRNVEAHADIVREKSVQRQLVEIAKEVEEQTKDKEQEPDQILGNAEKRVLELKEKYGL